VSAGWRKHREKVTLMWRHPALRLGRFGEQSTKGKVPRPTGQIGFGGKPSPIPLFTGGTSSTPGRTRRSPSLVCMLAHRQCLGRAAWLVMPTFGNQRPSSSMLSFDFMWYCEFFAKTGHGSDTCCQGLAHSGLELELASPPITLHGCNDTL
jgi:hypothetical protein